MGGTTSAADNCCETSSCGSAITQQREGTVLLAVSLEANCYMIALSEFPDGAPLEANTKLVGLVLAYHHNKQTRTAWPSMETIARESLRSLATIKRALAAMELHFLIGRIRGHGRGNLTFYSFLELDEPDRLRELLNGRKPDVDKRVQNEPLSLQLIADKEVSADKSSRQTFAGHFTKQSTTLDDRTIEANGPHEVRSHERRLSLNLHSVKFRNACKVNIHKDGALSNLSCVKSDLFVSAHEVHAA